MNGNSSRLIVDNKQAEFQVKGGTIGPSVIDISKLYAETGMFTYDPGFTSTAACESAITYIDGDEGVLLYRGYPIEQLAEHGDFLETCYLLLYGELPTAAQKADFDYRVTRHTMAHKYHVGQPFVYPQNHLDYTSNFLRMCFAVPAEEYKVNPVLSRALDRIFILHADHEQNASTSTVRLAGSSGANPFACIAAGVALLWGAAPRGADEAWPEVLRGIGTPARIPEFIARAKDKNDPFRLMGFGHRVYKNFDPRAKVMKESADEVLGLFGTENNPTL